MPKFEEVLEILKFYKEKEPSTYDKYMNIYKEKHPEIYEKLKEELEKGKEAFPGLDFLKMEMPRKKLVIILAIIAVVIGVYMVISKLPLEAVSKNTPPKIEEVLIPEKISLNSSIMPEITISDKEGNVETVSLRYVSPSKKEHRCNAEKRQDKWIGCSVSLNEGGTWKILVSAKDVSQTKSTSFEIHVPFSETCEAYLDCGELLCKNRILFSYSCINNTCYSKKEIVKCCEDSDCVTGKVCNKTTFACFEPPEPPKEIICGDEYCDEIEDCGSCPEDCLPEGEICCNNKTYAGNCCNDTGCGVGESCSNHICQINIHGMIVKITFNDTALRRNATTEWDGQMIKLWSDPVEVFESQPASGCNNDTNFKSVYQAIASLDRINKMDNLTNTDKTKIAGWILSKYEDGEFKDCFGTWYHDEIKTLYALKILKYIGYLSLAVEYEDNITASLYNNYALQGFNELPNMCTSDFDDSNSKIDYSRQISVYLQVKELFNKTIPDEEKFDAVNALKCSFKTDDTWIDTENIYWTVEALNIVDSLDIINKNKTIDWIESCQYDDGHFGKDLYSPSISGHWHAVKSLNILNATDKINKNLALDWTTSRLLRNWTSFRGRYGLKDEDIYKKHEDLKLRFYTLDSYFMLKQDTTE